MQEHILELIQEYDLAEGEYPIWSPYDAHESPVMLYQLLEQDKDVKLTEEE